MEWSNVRSAVENIGCGRGWRAKILRVVKMLRKGGCFCYKEVILLMHLNN